MVVTPVISKCNQGDVNTTTVPNQHISIESSAVGVFLKNNPAQQPAICGRFDTMT